MNPEGARYHAGSLPGGNPGRRRILPRSSGPVKHSTGTVLTSSRRAGKPILQSPGFSSSCRQSTWREGATSAGPGNYIPRSSQRGLQTSGTPWSEHLRSRFLPSGL